MKTKLRAYIALMRLDRPIGIYLLLWPTLWALWIASQGHPQTKNLIILILGTVVARSAGCVINDFADRHIDDKVSRTCHRPLANGIVQPFEAIILFCILGILALVLVSFLNGLAILLAIVGAFITIIYPLLKRFTYFPQLILGFAMSFGVPVAFAAETGHLSYLTAIIFLISYLWVIIYDTFYAMSDRADDLMIGVKSIAIYFSHYDRLITSLLQGAMLLLLISLGWLLSLNIWFYLAIAVSVGLACYQQYLIKDREADRCLQAFLNNHWVGLTIFMGLFFSYLLVP